MCTAKYGVLRTENPIRSNQVSGDTPKFLGEVDHPSGGESFSFSEQRPYLDSITPPPDDLPVQDSLGGPDQERDESTVGACGIEPGTNDERVPVEKWKERSNELWRLPIVKRVSGLGRSSIYTRIRDGTFPQAIDLDGGPMRAWISSQVLDWVDQQIKASHKAKEP